MCSGKNWQAQSRGYRGGLEMWCCAQQQEENWLQLIAFLRYLLVRKTKQASTVGYIHHLVSFYPFPQMASKEAACR